MSCSMGFAALYLEVLYGFGSHDFNYCGTPR